MVWGLGPTRMAGLLS